MSASSPGHSARPGTLSQWRSLFEPAHAALINAASDIDPADAASVEKLRRNWPAELVRLALDLAAARRRAAVKFGEDAAARLICDVTGVEQASSRCVAEHKAKRFATVRADRIIDLCCGIGGDAMSLATVGDVVAVDRNETRAWMAGRNAACDSIVADAESIDVAETVVHIDPDRRSGARVGQRRTWRIEDYEPGPVYLRKLMARADSVAIKLGPGAAFEELIPRGDSEIELISECGTLVQAVLWIGRLALHSGLRSATMLPAGDTFTGEADAPIRTDAIGSYVYTVDPSIERADLLGAFIEQYELSAVHPKVGLLTGDGLVRDPWLTPFGVQSVLPWRQPKVQQWLRAHGAGIVEVKTRGGIVNPDELQRKLRGDGDAPFTVFVLRMDRKAFAIICQRVEP